MNARALSIARSVGVIGATGALIVGATLAAATNTVSMTGITFAGTADLQIAKVANGTPGTYMTTQSGFDFSGLHLGKDSAPQTISLKNTSGASLNSVLILSPAPAPSFTHTDADHVMITIKEDVTGGNSVTEPLSLFLASQKGGGQLLTLKSALADGQAEQFDVILNVDSTGGAIDASSADPSPSPSASPNPGFELDFMGQ